MSRPSKPLRTAPLFVLMLATPLFCFAGQNPPAKALDQNPVRAKDDLRERAARALIRDPRALPFAEEAHWSKWGPKDPVVAELQPELGAAMRAYTAGDYSASLALFYALLDREPDFPPALYQGGLCYFRLRRYTDAASLLERFVHVAPQEIGASQALGHCYYSLGDFARAREHYEKVLVASPASPEALRGLALSVLRLGDPKRALELLGKVLALRPDHVDAHAWCAQILFDEGDSTAALVHAERVCDLEPWEPRGWFLLSRIYGDLGRDSEADRARERFDVASRLDQQVRQQEGLLLHDPARVETWVQLIALQRAGLNRAAVRDALPRLAALAPRDARSSLVIVDAYEWLGDKSRAKLAAVHAESVAGNDNATWNWLADFYRRMADVSAAERATKAAAKGH